MAELFDWWEYALLVSLTIVFGFISLQILVTLHSWYVGPLVDDEPELEPRDEEKQ